MKNNTELTPSYGDLPQSIAPTSIQESLLDTRSLLEKRLKSQLALSSDLVDQDLVRLLIKHLLADFAKNDSGLSDNTIKTLFIYWQSFELWCHKHQCTSLPASATTFVDYMNDRKSAVKMNTLSQYRWAVSKIHLAAGLPSPCHTQKSIDVVGGIRKQKIRSSELVTQASPFRSSHCDALIDLWIGSGTPLQYRNLAIMVTAYETMMRESELARIELAHISYQSDGRATLLIPFTKTNISGDPDTVMLSRQCVKIINNYLSHTVNKSNFLFKKMTRNGKPAQHNGPISRYTVDRVFKRAFNDLCTKNINLTHEIAPWSGHSARVGACQDLLSAGYSILEVQQAGRWASSEMVYRYGRNILAKESAMAKARWGR
ncbi:tyrosine-type recombinase/integrase [Shewanella sp. VB17]|uniref:tyrosine-type recombinase/integrase n=1 Tax=Shewanella sp. VB17 TaxID=2739432 RepID=UPI001566D67E|nr:tyrosine-type recombinase/integrase [Shewanella sp. VB17]NRD74061.1 tyrosine-type recombinase/integrase [Shewanella sp. VB17]